MSSSPKEFKVGDIVQASPAIEGGNEYRVIAVHNEGGLRTVDIKSLSGGNVYKNVGVHILDFSLGKPEPAPSFFD